MIALEKDLGKEAFESYASEILIVKRTLRFTYRNMAKWAKPKKVRPSLLMFGKKSRILVEPKGNVLIIGPYNYPVQLTLVPLITAIASGNTVMIKPSERTLNTSYVIKEMLEEIFPWEYISVEIGGVELNETLLSYPYDLIFFTGSEKVGKIVMEKAAKNLSPVILELGGKSPAIVLDDANLKTAAKRIAWGSYLNGGQTCVAPDYVLVDESIASDFVALLIKETEAMFSNFPYKMLDEARLKSYLIENEDLIVHGGMKEGKLVPTILFGEVRGSITKDEIFGPILPVIPIKNMESIQTCLELNPYPLALYVFSGNKNKIKQIINYNRFGGGMVNDTILHLVNESLPFGGVRTSGIGSYHGKYGFESFSNLKSIVYASKVIGTPFMYPPYKEKLTWFRKFFF